jgi:hypothetical protein
MNRLVPLLSAALLAGCMTPTWQTHVAGAPVQADRVLLVGSFAAVPPINQEREGPPPRCYSNGTGSCGASILVGRQSGNLMAFFTPDPSAPMRASINRMPFDDFEWSWIPMDGAFVIEVPRRDAIYLRGVQYYTKGDEGGVRFELPAHVALRASDRVVYVGEIRLVRTGDRRVIFSDRLAATRGALEAGGYADVLALPWRTQLLAP